jgi:N-acetyl-anhydromuramyl-L-alanine amidase AmpD
MKITHHFLDEKYKKVLWSKRYSDVDTIIIHAMSAVNVYSRNPFSVKKCIKIFVDYDVSAHYIIDRKGKIYYLVSEENKAWHAGSSRMPFPDNREKVNDFSIGIELVGDEKTPFEDKQYEALNFLLNDIRKRYNIRYLLGHQDIAGQKLVKEGLRKEAKWDPGKMFDWRRVICISILSCTNIIL